MTQEAAQQESAHTTRGDHTHRAKLALLAKDGKGCANLSLVLSTLARGTP